MKPRLAKPVRLDNLTIFYKNKTGEVVETEAKFYVRTLYSSAFICETGFYDARDINIVDISKVAVSYRDYFTKYVLRSQPDANS